MVVVHCPSCQELMEIEENELHVEWECPTCGAAFRVQKSNDGSYQFNITAPAPPSSAIQTQSTQRKNGSRRRKRKKGTDESSRDGEPNLDISLAPSLSLQTRFPEVQPGNPLPLFTFNGFGTMLYGSRDFDEATGTYVASACLVFFFVPIFIIGAYRVADAQSSGWFSSSGWHVLGRVPLSPLARGWNWVMAALLILFVLFLMARA